MNPGTRVGGHVLVRKVGAGGMGEVWLAEHAMLGRRAAIKLLHPSLSMRAEIVTRFFNEARAATTIADPGIVQVFDFGRTDDGTAYIVMELLEGETLDARCRSVGLLPVADALRIVRQVASSLGAAHARGIVHRDLKPENIFLVRDGEVAGGERAKILDFGIAKLAGDAGVKTQTSAVMGTPTFMSPEQCRGAGHVDARSDVYSLGCVLFAILTGRPPFAGEGIGDLIVMHMREPAPLASSVVSTIPAAVDMLVARCLEKDPARRFASGGELATAIDAIRVAAQPTIAVPRAFTAVVTPTTLSGAASAIERPPPPRRGRRVVAGLVALGLGGGGIALVATRGPGSRPDVDTASAPVAIDAGDAAEPLSIDAAPVVIDAAVDAAVHAAVHAAVDAAVVFDASVIDADIAPPDAPPRRAPKRSARPATPAPSDRPTPIEELDNRSLPRR